MLQYLYNYLSELLQEYGGRGGSIFASSDAKYSDDPSWPRKTDAIIDADQTADLDDYAMVSSHSKDTASLFGVLESISCVIRAIPEPVLKIQRPIRSWVIRQIKQNITVDDGTYINDYVPVSSHSKDTVSIIDIF